MEAYGDLLAGDFSAWLGRVREALLTEGGTDVDCTDCDACCSSSYFIHIRPEEALTLGHIPKAAPTRSPRA